MVDYTLPMVIDLESIMHTFTDKDVWGHIIKYFRFSLSDESIEDIRIKRRTLRSIALVSSRLTSVAVSELWRSMETLEPVIYTFNAPPYHALSAAFEYKRDNSSEHYWEMARSSDDWTDDIISRVLDYLSHVQYLHFTTYPSKKERTLWKGLIAFDWIIPLCPNLRGITFTGGKNYPSATYDLLPLLVPSLQSIRFDSATTAQDEAAVSMLLGLIKHRKIQISDLVYRGYSSCRLVKQIFQFPNLRSVDILESSGYDDFLEASDIQSFLSSTHLTNLDIDLGIFQSALGVGSWVEALPSLSRLSLQGTPPVIIDVLRSGSFALVHSLSLFLHQPNRAPSLSPNIFSIISSAFPNLHSLCLQNKERFNITNGEIKLSDIQALRARSLRRLTIHCLRLSLSLSHVVCVVGTWPTLEHLSLVPDLSVDFEKYDAKKLLPLIARRASHITDLNLPLKLSPLRAQPLIAGETVCPLQRLELTLARNPSSSLEKDLMLAQNFLTLFPRLHVVTSNRDIKELQIIVKSFRRMLSSVPRRGDNLY